MTNKHKLLVTALLLVLLVTSLFLPLPLAPENRTVLNNTWISTAHLPLFAIIGVILLFLSRQLLNTYIQKHYQHYLLALGASIFIGISSELLQSLDSSRSAEWVDLLYDVCGSLSGLLTYLLFDPAYRESAVMNKRHTRLAILSLAILCWLPPAINISMIKHTYAQRAQALPVLINFADNWHLPFISTGNGTLLTVNKPHQWTQIRNQRVARWQTGIQTNWPYIRLREITSDWSTYQGISLSIYSTSSEPVALSLRIDDKSQDSSTPHIKYAHVKLQPGHNLAKINFQGIHAKQIKFFWFGLHRPSKAHTLYIGEARLY